MKVCFAIIGSIASTTRESVNHLECKLKDTLFLKRKKLLRRVVSLKTTLILQKKKFLLMLFCKCVLLARDKLRRYGRAISNYFSQQSIQRVYAKMFYSKSFNAIVNQFDGNV